VAISVNFSISYQPDEDFYWALCPYKVQVRRSRISFLPIAQLQCLLIEK